MKLTINSIDIQEIGPIQELHLDFDPHFNVLCGANGVGKTTVLDCVAQSFVSHARSNTGEKRGRWRVNYDFSGSRGEEIPCSSYFEKWNSETQPNQFDRVFLSLLVLEVNRLPSYYKKDKELRLSIPTGRKINKLISHGVTPRRIKWWLINRYMQINHGTHLKETIETSWQSICNCLQVINPEFSLKRVNPDTRDIFLSTPHGIVEMDQLSSGYITMLVTLLSVIEEVERRYNILRFPPWGMIEDFSGVVILDEMDMHLHPSLHVRMYKALKKLLPNAQIITSTLSPYVIQIAHPSEVMPLVRDDTGVHLNPLINREYGCQGWTIEEILEDIMDICATRTSECQELFKQFNKGIDSEDGAGVKATYQKLMKMLHPQSVLREVLRIQTIGVCHDKN